LYRINTNSICVWTATKDMVLDSISLHESVEIKKVKLSMVSLGILNIMLSMTALIHICLYQSVLVEELKIPIFLFALMRTEKRK
jgi:hypothetical protein